MHSLDINYSNLLNPIIDGLNTLLPKIPAAILQIVVGVILIKFASRMTRIFLSLVGMPKSFRQVIGSVISSVLYAVLFIFVLQTLGLGGIVTFFTGSVLAIGLVMAAGGSTLVSDIIAGLFLSTHPDFNVGDEIIAGENLTEGVIVSMDSRRVRVRDKKGNLHVLPNSIVERKEWVVLQRHVPKASGVDMIGGAKKLTSAAARKASEVIDKANKGDK
jgi:small-conductance mechanosensitive channel